MERILVIDDDPITLSMVNKILQTAGFSVDALTDPVEAVNSFHGGVYDLVLTDFFMPSLSGQQVVEKIRAIEASIPVIILTASMDLEITVELFKNGVTDYIVKPVIPNDLLHRVRTVIDEVQLRLEIQRVDQEKKLMELESQKLVNWRMLYAYKDISQTEQMINLLTRTINADGGYGWLDLLNELPRNDDGGLTLDQEVLDLVLSSAGAQRVVFDYLGFISQLPRMKLDVKTMPARQLVLPLAEFAHGELASLVGRHGHALSIHVPSIDFAGTVSADLKQLKRICKELVVNAIKYSPPMSRLTFEIIHTTSGTISGAGQGDDCLGVLVRNPPRQLQARGKDGSVITGIPYDYSELVFDLFFTIESFSNTIDEEEWPDGTGLYVARKLLGRMGAIIGNRSVMDYTGNKPQPLVQLGLGFPLQNIT